ncbi:hypothetical protein O181_092542 [Austropuccinia psidii MF-1]|uniref:Uncharacterized protein n=1 Tax=Austropuccinia psidii MF-1 TaxID=1389203 RepID=A0A9Q3IZP6_9BASI|nr:hypothetical protein [Austropuccinia psidii MF-1]
MHIQENSSAMVHCSQVYQHLPVEPIPFQLVMDSLAYLVSRSRPDLAFAVNYLGQNSMGPIEVHWVLLDHVTKYLLKTKKPQLVPAPRKAIAEPVEQCWVGRRPQTLSIEFYP